jgi:ribosome maturation factor RimP
MNKFKDYLGKEVEVGCRVLLPEKNKFVRGTISEIYGNCFNIKCDDGHTRDCGWFDHFLKIENEETIL